MNKQQEEGVQKLYELLVRESEYLEILKVRTLYNPEYMGQLNQQKEYVNKLNDNYDRALSAFNKRRIWSQLEYDRVQV